MNESERLDRYLDALADAWPAGKTPRRPPIWTRTARLSPNCWLGRWRKMRLRQRAPKPMSGSACSARPGWLARSDRRPTAARPWGASPSILQSNRRNL